MLTTLLTAIDIIALTISCYGNSFLLVANALEWRKTKAINTSDQLICGISFFSSLYEVLKLCGYILQLPPIGLVVTYDVRRVSTVVCLAIISCNIWISTWLSVSFCFKIVNIQQKFYMYLQRRLPRLMIWLLLPSALVSYSLSLTFSWDIFEKDRLNVTLNNSRKNESALFILRRCACLYEAFIVFSSLGFPLSLASLVTIIKSLYRHVKNMRKSGENFQNPNLDTHTRAIRTIALLLLINAFFCYALALTALKGNDLQWSPYIYIFTSVCHALNSFNIILGNSKLKRSYFASFGLRMQNNARSG
ncbi:hypothetical protein GDO81_014959 [Engystomops pustulosus]|uniref:Taste receptor type 2 n=1 Tax=Engystomops pustulosus TaxID=76066 RepID=A0AAV7AFT2_ENGPU|nr:hypothetical protein GDO81_014959 [Engystomops pustulosus]